MSAELTLCVALSAPERDFLLIACGMIPPASSRSRPGAIDLTAEGVLALRERLKAAQPGSPPEAEPVARLAEIAAAIEIAPGDGISFRETGAVQLAADIRRVLDTRPSSDPSATERINGAEMPEVAMARYIEILRAEEGDTVTICCDNPEAHSIDARLAIDCNGGWTDYKDRRFTGESVLQCLARAVIARDALEAAK